MRYEPFWSFSVLFVELIGRLSLKGLGLIFQVLSFGHTLILQRSLRWPLSSRFCFHIVCISFRNVGIFVPQSSFCSCLFFLHYIGFGFSCLFFHLLPFMASSAFSALYCCGVCGSFVAALSSSMSRCVCHNRLICAYVRL